MRQTLPHGEPKTELEKLRTQLYKAMFRKKAFEFITQNKHKKQDEALQYLTDDIHEEILYGGAAGGSKSWTGCCWLIFMCLNYNNTRWFVGREELKRLTQSTLVTFQKVFSLYGYHQKYYKYNAQMCYITFVNNSRIDFLELKRKPSDPDYERFGSLEYTGGWIEEAGEINFGAYDILRTRVGRHNNEKHSLLPKIFLTCNPKRNWLYELFYKPFKEKKLPKKYAFVEAKVTDNPFISPVYIERLKDIRDDTKKQRLLFGNWEYMNNPLALCDDEAIDDIFSNVHVVNKFAPKYITGDIARFGSDNTVIGVWKGWELIDIITMEISSVVDSAKIIKQLKIKHRVPTSRIVVDEDGVGGGVVDILKVKGFVNNSKPIATKRKQVVNYRNLQTQCIYMLSDIINENKIYISANLDMDVKEMIIADLSSIAPDGEIDNVLTIIKKSKVKEQLGRSPDFRDMIAMRCFFDLKPRGHGGFQAI